MSGRWFLFSIHFVIGPISYRKNYFNILEIYILIKRPLEKLHLHPQWGPDTHNRPHQRGAASKAEQPLCVQGKIIIKKNMKSFSISDEIKYPITSLVINYYIG